MDEERNDLDKDHHDMTHAFNGHSPEIGRVHLGAGGSARSICVRMKCGAIEERFARLTSRSRPPLEGLARRTALSVREELCACLQSPDQARFGASASLSIRRHVKGLARIREQSLPAPQRSLASLEFIGIRAKQRDVDRRAAETK